MSYPRQGTRPLARAALRRSWLRRSKRLFKVLAKGSKAGDSSAAGFAPGIIVVALMLALMLWALPREETEAQSAFHAPITADQPSSVVASR